MHDEQELPWPSRDKGFVVVISGGKGISSTIIISVPTDAAQIKNQVQVRNIRRKRKYNPLKKKREEKVVVLLVVVLSKVSETMQ
jgi:hypothetical protein